MTVPSPMVATSGTGAAPVTADNFNSYEVGGMNLAAARGFSGVQNQEIHLIGYVTTNDGGQGNFVWTLGTGTDDGGATTIVPTGNTSGYWARVTTTSIIVGVTTNSNAPAGDLGEYISSTVLAGNALSVTTATPLNITSISLTPGDWDVRGSVVFVGAGSTVLTQVTAAIGQTSATLPTLPAADGYSQISGTLGTGTTQVLSAGVTRVSLAITTTIYLLAQATFTTSTLTAYGFLAARRVR